MGHNKITVAGIGPGAPEYVLPAARTAIENAKILVGGARALSDFAREDQKTMTIRGDIPGVLRFIRENLETSDVVVMVSGDPGYFSLLDALRREFDPSLIYVIPGVSAVQFAFSRLALPWHDASLVSFHGRVPEKSAIEYSPGKFLGILTDTKYNSRTIPKILMENGWPPETTTAICARLSYDDERVIMTTLEKASDAREETHAVMVVIGK